MNCKKAEQYLLRSFDGLLKQKEMENLEKHLESCSLCREKKKEYTFMFNILSDEKFPEQKPYLWQRIQPRLQKQKKYLP